MNADFLNCETMMKADVPLHKVKYDRKAIDVKIKFRSTLKFRINIAAVVSAVLMILVLGHYIFQPSYSAGILKDKFVSSFLVALCIIPILIKILMDDVFTILQQADGSKREAELSFQNFSKNKQLKSRMKQ